MDETKKIGFFRAFINTGKAFGGDTKISNAPIEWENLNKRDFEYADVNEDEQKALNISLKKVKLFVTKFYENIKSGVKSVVNKFKTTSIEREEKSEEHIENKEDIKESKEHGIRD